MFHVLSFQNHLNRVLLNSVFSFLRIILLVVVSVSFSHAATISNFGQWRNLSSVTKTAYTAGAIDTFLDPIEASANHREFNINFLSCFKRLQITIVEVVEMIDNFYLNTENHSLTPQQAIKFQLINGHCFKFLN